MKDFYKKPISEVSKFTPVDAITTSTAGDDTTVTTTIPHMVDED